MLTKSQINKIKNKIKIETVRNDSRLPLIFGALGDLGRFRIFELLMEQRDLCVTEVAEVLDITVPAASQQLKILELVGLVKKTRMGQMVCYEINNDDANPVIKSLIKMISLKN